MPSWLVNSVSVYTESMFAHECPRWPINSANVYNFSLLGILGAGRGGHRGPKIPIRYPNSNNFQGCVWDALRVSARQRGIYEMVVQACGRGWASWRGCLLGCHFIKTGRWMTKAWIDMYFLLVRVCTCLRLRPFGSKFCSRDGQRRNVFLFAPLLQRCTSLDRNGRRCLRDSLCTGLGSVLQVR